MWLLRATGDPNRRIKIDIDPKLRLEKFLVQRVVSEPKADPNLVEPVEKLIALRHLQRLPKEKRFHGRLGLSLQSLSV